MLDVQCAVSIETHASLFLPINNGCLVRFNYRKSIYFFWLSQFSLSHQLELHDKQFIPFVHCPVYFNFFSWLCCEVNTTLGHWTSTERTIQYQRLLPVLWQEIQQILQSDRFILNNISIIFLHSARNFFSSSPVKRFTTLLMFFVYRVFGNCSASVRACAIALL